MSLRYCSHDVTRLTRCPFCEGAPSNTPFDFVSYGWQATINKAAKRGPKNGLEDCAADLRAHLLRKRPQLEAAAAINGWNSPRMKAYARTICLNYLDDKQTTNQAQFERGIDTFGLPGQKAPDVADKQNYWTRVTVAGDGEVDAVEEPERSGAGPRPDLRGTPPIWAAVCDRIWDNASEEEVAAELKISAVMVRRILVRVYEFLHRTANLRRGKVWTFEDHAFYGRYCNTGAKSTLQPFTGYVATAKLLQAGPVRKVAGADYERYATWTRAMGAQPLSEMYWSLMGGKLTADNVESSPPGPKPSPMDDKHRARNFVLLFPTMPAPALVTKKDVSMPAWKCEHGVGRGLHCALCDSAKCEVSPPIFMPAVETAVGVSA
jgi:hypothetical protein